MEAQLLLWLHQHESAVLDAFFLVGHHLGGGEAMGYLVLFAVAWNVRRKRWHAVGLWLGLAVSTTVLWFALKHGIGRPRPELWERLIWPARSAFPSGHALGTATFLPLLARDLGDRWPKGKPVFLVTAVTLALYVGVGRMYLGVHWPTDVLAGWLLGFGQCWLGIRIVAWREAKSG